MSSPKSEALVDTVNGLKALAVELEKLAYRCRHVGHSTVDVAAEVLDKLDEIVRLATGFEK